MFKCEIRTGGAAFHSEKSEMDPFLDREIVGQEVSRLLKKIAMEIQRGSDYGSIIDLNGNKVGEWSLE